MNGLTTIVGIIGALWVCAGAALPAADPGSAPLAAPRIVAETRRGTANPDLLPALDRLAQARRRDGSLDAAAALRRRALAVTIAVRGAGSRQAATAMTALAMVEIDRRRYLDAEPLLIVADRVLRDLAAAAGDVAVGLAQIALARGDPTGAEALARRALSAAGSDPRSSPAALRALGAALSAQRNFGGAEQILVEALRRDTQQGGPDAAGAARTLSQLANLHLRQGRPAEALPLTEQALMIDQRRLGPNHPFIADDLHDLGLAYDALKRRDDARRAFRAAIAVLERGDGRDTPRVAYAEIELGRLYRQQGKTAAADAAQRDARRILTRAEAEERRRERQV